MNRRKIIVFIVGPTAIGKTRLAIKLALRINGEIISSDSMQIYKGLAVLSQAPTMAERKRVRHYLVGVLDPAREYSAASFIAKAAILINSIIERGKIPLVVGGSGLYVKALIYGLFPSPPADLRFRSSTQRFIHRYGTAELHKRLARIDPESSLLIHPNDGRRIIRALEIYHSTGKTMTQLKAETTGLAGRYDIRVFGLKKPRNMIYEEIEARTDRMFKNRMLNEVKRLRRKKLSKTAAAVLGFKEISGYLDGEYDLDAAKALLKQNTRRFAKRQLTWFRADKRIRWFDAAKMGEGEIIRQMRRAIRGNKGR